MQVLLLFWHLLRTISEAKISLKPCIAKHVECAAVQMVVVKNFSFPISEGSSFATFFYAPLRNVNEANSRVRKDREIVR